MVLFTAEAQLQAQAKARLQAQAEEAAEDRKAMASATRATADSVAKRSILARVTDEAKERKKEEGADAAQEARKAASLKALLDAEEAKLAERKAALENEAMVAAEAELNSARTPASKKWTTVSRTVLGTGQPIQDKIAAAHWQEWQRPARTAGNVLEPLRERKPHADGHKLIAEHPDWKLDLRLRSKGLQELHEQLLTHEQLEEFDCSRNVLIELPDALGAALRNLITLDVSRNILASLPRSIGALQLLETLDCSNNNLTSLPSTIGCLSRLHTLDASFNKLRRLPDSVGQPIRIPVEALDTHRLDNATSWPMGRLEALTALDVSWNQLIALPLSLGKVTSLKALSCAHNKLSKLPKIGGMQLLETLDLSHNALASVPESLGALGRLERLELVGNESDLPMALSQAPWYRRSRLHGQALLDHTPATIALRLRERDAERRKGIEDVYNAAQQSADPFFRAARFHGSEIERLNAELDNFDFGKRQERVRYGDLMELQLEAKVQREEAPPYDNKMRCKINVGWYGAGTDEAICARKDGHESLRRTYHGPQNEGERETARIAIAEKAARDAAALHAQQVARSLRLGSGQS